MLVDCVHFTLFALAQEEEELEVYAHVGSGGGSIVLMEVGSTLSSAVMAATLCKLACTCADMNLTRSEMWKYEGLRRTSGGAIDDKGPRFSNPSRSVFSPEFDRSALPRTIIIVQPRSSAARTVIVRRFVPSYSTEVCRFRIRYPNRYRA